MNERCRARSGSRPARSLPLRHASPSRTRRDRSPGAPSSGTNAGLRPGPTWRRLAGGLPGRTVGPRGDASTPPDAIAVLGSGNMGSGIAQACAQAGFSVRVRDLTDAQIARGRGLIESTLDGAVQRKKMTPAQRVGGARADPVHHRTSARRSEARSSSSRRSSRRRRSRKRCSPRRAPDLDASAIVATNTSSLSVSRLAAHLPDPCPLRRPALLLPRRHQQARRDRRRGRHRARGARDPGEVRLRPSEGPDPVPGQRGLLRQPVLRAVHERGDPDGRGRARLLGDHRGGGPGADRARPTGRSR